MFDKDMFNRNTVLIAVAIVFTIGIFIGVSKLSSDEEDNPKEAAVEVSETKQPAKKNYSDFTDTGQYYDEMVGYIDHFDLSSFNSNWTIGVVESHHGNTINVRTGIGVITLFPGDVHNTKGPCYRKPLDFLSITTDLKDVVVYNEKEGDTNICPGEIVVLGKASEK